MSVHNPRYFYFFWGLSCVTAAFAQPVWLPLFGPVAAAVSYGLFILLVLGQGAWTWRRAFAHAFLWFFIVQAVQWSWFPQETFQGKYIYAAYVVLMSLWGGQFGIFVLCARRFPPNTLSRVAGLAALWMFMEYSRLFILTGSTFNPIGMALTCHPYSLQWAAIGGIFGLCFWVMFSNALFARAALKAWAPRATVLWLAAALIPYAYGFDQLQSHERRMDAERIGTLKVLLVQTAQPPVDFLPEADRRNLFDYALRHWQRILTDLMEHHSSKPELIVLPESSVPYGTYHPAYTYEAVLATFETLLGEEGRRALPPLEEPLAALYEEDGSDIWLVSNAFWAQALANSFDAEVVIGLAHHEHVDQRRVSYNSALRFVPQKVEHERYDKRVLLPMGEYIPFAWARGIAARYGVYGSFTAGQEIKVFQHAKVPYGISICYEETFSELMRANRLAGAELLVNVTSDVWYPNTRLPEQHLEHARVRTVEAGLPLIRACNTGVTACVDALGRDIAVFGDESGPYEWRRGVLAAELPLYSYPTLFTQMGDRGLVYFAALCLLFACLGELWAARGRAD